MGTDVTESITKFVAGKKFSIGKMTYKAGDPVDTKGLPDHKIKQFLRQRFLEPNLEQTQ